MKKTLFLSLLCFSPIISFSQVGINTTNPKATLDVVGSPSITTEIDGFLPPRITRSQLVKKTVYGADQIGVLIYVTDIKGISNASTIHITKAGYYYFDGSVWIPIESKSAISYGDTKQGFQSADHDGWVKLDGRLVSTLTPSQQARAIALGFNKNIPDATGSVLMQNGTALGSIAGTNNKTISHKIYLT